MDDGKQRVEIRFECLRLAVSILSLRPWKSLTSNYEEGYPPTPVEVIEAANKIFKWVEK